MQQVLDSTLDHLSEEERAQVLAILNEIAQNGSSEQFDALLKEDWAEIPVDIETFITDEQYLGKAYIKNGKYEFYPAWKEILKDIFPDNFNTKYNEVLLSGATGVGKSNTAVTCILYMLHRLMCLKDPLSYLNLTNIDKITITLLNITLDQAEKVAWQKMIDMIRISPWFMARGSLTGTKHFMYTPNNGCISLEIASTAEHCLGKAIFIAFLDEASFKKGHSVKLQENAMMNIYNTVNERMKSRYIKAGGLNPCLMIMASSKRAESSFMEQYIEGVKKQGRADVLVVDKPRWEIKPAHNYSGRKFKVAVGNKYLISEIVREGSDEMSYLNQGYTIIEVPIEEKTSFEQDIDTALMNVAGISSSNVMKFISGKRLEECVRDYVNPFGREILQIGLDDTLQIKDFFDASIIPEEIFTKPVFIHIDTSLSGDKTGISAVCIEGAKESPYQIPDQETVNVELFYRHLFTVAIKAPKTSQISLEKTRQFIYYLKSLGWRIKAVSTDGFQSADTQQILTTKGYEAKVISLDKTPNGYNTFKAAIYEKRVGLIRLDNLFEEVVNLEKDNVTGKIDHPEHGKIGSKDESDSLCGALYSASLFKSEYIYQHGEDLADAIDVNTAPADIRQQITISMTEALRGNAPKEQKQESAIQQEPNKDKKIMEIKSTGTATYDPFVLASAVHRQDEVFIPDDFGDFIIL